MLLKKYALLLILALSCSVVRAAGFLEREVIFTEAEIQAALTKSGPIQKNYGGLMTVALKEAPQISLNTPDGRIHLMTRMDIMLFGNPPVGVNVTARGGIRYDDKTKAFFLENAVADSVESIALPKEMESSAKQAVTQLINGYFRSKPLYVLREDGNQQEITARWLLKSIRIEPGRVVATLSPI